MFPIISFAVDNSPQTIDSRAHLVKGLADERETRQSDPLRISGWAQLWVRLAPNGTNPEISQIIFSTFWLVVEYRGIKKTLRVLLLSILYLSITTLVVSGVVAGLPNLDPKWVRLALNGTNPALRQNILKSDLKKSRICPIWGQSDPFWVQIW